MQDRQPVEDKHSTKLDLLQSVLEQSLSAVEPPQNRAAVLLLNYEERYGVMEYLSVGDMMVLHLRPAGYKLGEVSDSDSDPATKSTGKFRSLFKRAAESGGANKLEALKLQATVEQSYFDTVHSDYVGKNSVKAYNKGGLQITRGDFIICMNRGVADSLYPQEVLKIVEQFNGQSTFDVNIDLDIMAGVITQKAFNKIVRFDQDRPLVKRIQTFLYDPKQVSVDECFCLAIKAV